MFREFVRHFILALAVLCTTTLHLHAQDNQCTVNGCGPGGVLGKLIPNKYQGYFAQCEFKNACDKHDKCYSNCMKCSSWYGTERCKEKSCWFSWENTFKSQCDEQLYTDISLANQGNRVCDGFASVYKAAVKLLGCNFYYGQKFSRDKQLQFQKNFDALMQYYEFHRRNDIPLDRKSLDAVIDQLSRSPAVEKNIFDFSIRKGAPTLSVEAFDMGTAGAPKPAPETLAKGVRISRYINGIEVTNMIDDSATFAARNVPASRQPFDLKIELDLKQGTGPTASEKFDYETFRDLRQLKDLDKLAPGR